MVAVIVTIVLSKKVESTSEYKESYTLVIKEVISLLEKLQEFYKGMNDFSGLVMIIPVDCYGNLYGYGGDRTADRIQVSLLFYEKIDEYLQDIINYTANKTDANIYFKLKVMDGNTFFIATSFSKFVWII